MEGDMKRLFPAKYSASMTRTPRFDAPKAAVYNKQRSKATSGSGGNTEHNFNSSFMKERKTHVFTRYGKKYYSPDDGGWMKYNYNGAKRELIQVDNLLSMYRVWQGRRRQGVSEYHCCVLKENKEKQYCLMLFFSGTEYLFVQEARERRWISTTYTTTKDLRSDAFKKPVGEINWIHTENITSTE
jgi:hypothetical protein